MPRVPIDITPKLHLLVSGDAGIGKTTLIGSAANDLRSAPVLHLNFGGNPQAMINNPDKDKIVVWQCERISELENILAWVKGGQGKGPVRDLLEVKEEVTFKTIAVDTIAGYQRLQYATLLKIPLHDIAQDKILEFKEWNLMWWRATNLAAYIFAPDWPTHSIGTVHIKTGMDGAGRTYEPMLYGQADFEVPGYAIAHGWLTWANECGIKVPKGSNAKRALVFREVLRHKTLKEQYGGRLPEVVWDPTMSKLLDLLEDEKS